MSEYTKNNEVFKDYIKKQLLKNNIVKKGKFILKSGIESDIYIDIKSINAYPTLMSSIIIAMSNQLKTSIIQNDRSRQYHKFYLCGVPLGGITIANLIGNHLNIPQVLLRDKVKDYGTKQMIEGMVHGYKDVIIIEDVITTGGSVLEAVEKLKKNGLRCIKIMSLIFRGDETTLEKLKEYDYQYLFSKDDLTEDRLNIKLRPANSLSNTINNFIVTKKSKIFLAIDKPMSPDELLLFLYEVKDYIIGIKIHHEILLSETIINPLFRSKLYEECKKMNLIVWEDRKFNDIGKTLEKQLDYYSNNTDIISVVPIGGLESIKNIKTNLKVFILAEMSSNNNLFNNILKNQILEISMNSDINDKVIGIICQDDILIDYINNYTNLLTIKPGIRISNKYNEKHLYDGKGQIWSDPRQFMVQPNIYVIGRDVMELETIDEIKEKLEYNNKIIESL
jgi:orotate phosphoribosyltransferase